MSSWMSEAAEEKLRQQAWDEYFAVYQEEFGELTDEELAQSIPVAYISGMRPDGTKILPV